jgi:hypothetical protein
MRLGMPKELLKCQPGQKMTDGAEKTISVPEEAQIFIEG